MRWTDAEEGDLTGGVSGWWDTGSAGGKGEEGSYEVIARGMGVETAEVVFFSDSIPGMYVLSGCLCVCLSLFLIPHFHHLPQEDTLRIGGEALVVCHACVCLY